MVGSFVRIFGGSCLILSLAACHNPVASTSVNTWQSTGGNIASSKLDCQFVGADVLAARMKVLLQIPSGDVPVLNNNGTASTTMRLARAAETLGKGDISKGRMDDLSCGTTKYKASIEIMTDACAIALSDSAMRQKLFPQGTGNFETVYSAFLGRSPTSFEAQVLTDLVAKIPAGKKEAAACGAVASSLEALIRI